MRLALLGVICLLASLSACRANPDSDNEPANYLRLAEPDDVPTLDPARGYDTASWQFEDMLFSTLVDYDAQGLLAPELALSWEATADQRNFTFHLRHDARFSNGRTVVAADVKYGIERSLNPATKSPGAEFFRGIAGAEKCSAVSCSVEGIRCPDQFTVEFQLSAFDPLFIHKLAMPFAAALPHEAVEQWGENFGRHPLGSGPYVLDEWKPGRYLRLRRNPDYFIPTIPRLQGVQRLVGVNDELAWFKYESGSLDVVDIPPAEFPRVIADKQYESLLRRVVTLRTQYVGMNVNLPPFDDVRVRRAINHAINKPKLLRLLNERGVVANGIVPINMPGFAPQLKGYSFDPEAARSLLREAGLSQGFSSTLWVRLDAVVLRLAQSIQQDLAEVGIQIAIKPLAWGPFLDAVKRTDLVPLFLLGWEADFPDPSNFLETLFHSKYIGTNNNVNYRNPAVDALLDQAATTIDPTTRLKLLQLIETKILEDAPWVPLYHPATYQMVNPRVRDYVLHPLRPARFESTSIDPIP